MSINCCTEFIKPITSKSHKIGTYVDFGPPGMPDAPIGTIYIDKHTNKTWMLNPQRKWVQMLTWADLGISMEEAIERISIFASKPSSQINEDILSGEGLAPLPCNLNFHNHYQEVVPGVVEEVSAYDTLGNKIATWTAYKSTAAKDITNCRNCGAPVYGRECKYCGTVY